MSRPGQIPLRFPEQSLSFDDMALTDANRGVIASVRKTARWPYHVFCLIGPAQSGLTTIARAWVNEQSGMFLSAEAFSDLSASDIEDLCSSALAIDRADQIQTETLLLNTISAVGRLGGRLLLTAPNAPAQWQSSSRDLASRLKSAPIADLGAPDEALMRARIQRACARAYLVLSKPVEDYLVTRLGLSFAGIEDAVLRLDGAAAKRPLSVPMVREVLGVGDNHGQQPSDED